MNPATPSGYQIPEDELLPLADFVEAHAEEIVRRAERAWESSILLFSQLYR